MLAAVIGGLNYQSKDFHSRKFCSAIKKDGNKCSLKSRRGGSYCHLHERSKRHFNWSTIIVILGLLIGAYGIITSEIAKNEILKLSSEIIDLNKKNVELSEKNIDLSQTASWLSYFILYKENEGYFLENESKFREFRLTSDGGIDLIEPYSTLDKTPTFYFYVDDENGTNQDYNCKISSSTKNFDDMEWNCSFFRGIYESPDTEHVCTLGQPLKYGLNKVFVSCLIDENNKSYLVKENKVIYWDKKYSMGVDNIFED